MCASLYLFYHQNRMGIVFSSCCNLFCMSSNGVGLLEWRSAAHCGCLHNGAQSGTGGEHFPHAAKSATKFRMSHYAVQSYILLKPNRSCLIALKLTPLAFKLFSIFHLAFLLFSVLIKSQHSSGPWMRASGHQQETHIKLIYQTLAKVDSTGLHLTRSRRWDLGSK